MPVKKKQKKLKIRKIKTKVVKSPAKKLKINVKKLLGKPIGVITHYYSGIKVGIFKFNKPVKVGSSIEIRGATTNFAHKISVMQYNYKEISTAPKGKQVGIKLKKRVRVGDKVYSVK